MLVHEFPDDGRPGWLHNHKPFKLAELRRTLATALELPR